MGLEAGWNCHISLQSDKHIKADLHGMGTSSQMDVMNIKSVSQVSSRHSSDEKDGHLLNNFTQSFDSVQSRSQSAPSVVNLDSSQVRFGFSPYFLPSFTFTI